MPETFEDICPRCLEPFPVSGDACVGGSFCPKCQQFSPYAPLKEAVKPEPLTGDVTVFVGTVAQMRAFASMVLSHHRYGTVPRELMESAAASLFAQIEADLSCHPATQQALREWNSRSEPETEPKGA